MQNNIDVSIITPYYNESLWMLKRNILSVKNQKTKYYKFEHIIVIDNPEISIEVLKLLDTLKLFWIIHSENKGLSAARNTALEDAKGKYIMLLDTDDVMVEGRIETQINFMENHGLDMSWGGYQEIHGQNKHPEKSRIIPSVTGWEDALKRFVNPCPCGSVCFKRKIHEEIGGYDENMKEGAEDMEYIYRIMINKYRMKCLPEVLYYLGITDQNMTAKLIANGGFDRANNYIKTKYPTEKWKI